MPLKHILIGTVTLIGLVNTSAARAQEPDVLEDLVVTAARTPIERRRIGSTFTVIDRAALETRQQALVSDALRDVPGVAVSRGGGLGAVTQARIRGSEGNHALVLIDGVEANNPVSNSEFDFANLLVSEIERIEILRGPQSALYGSDAVGGVINIITRERGAGLDATAHIEAGSLGTHELGLELGGGTERFSGGLGLLSFASDGENHSRSGAERDGFENRSLALHGRAALSERLTLRASLRGIDSEQDYDSQDFEFPATPTQGLLVDDDLSSALEQWFARLQADVHGTRLSQRITLDETRTENRFLEAGLTTGSNQGGKTKLAYQLTLDAGAPGAERALTVAFEHEQSDYSNRGARPDSAENQSQKDRQSSLVAEYLIHLERADFSVSARHDDNRLFEDARTWRLTGQYALSEHTRLHTSLGTGIANPGFFELFGFFPGSFVGNPALTPERSMNFDVGLGHRFDAARTELDVTYFHADLRDEIQTTFDFASYLSSVTNLAGESARRGVELSVGAELSDFWNVAASYTYTDAEQADGLAEVRRARHIASLDNTFRFAGGRASLHLGIDYNGEQRDNEFITATPETVVTLPSFTLVKLGGDYRLRSGLRLYMSVENLLGEAYEEWFSYRGRGRAAIAGLEFPLQR